MRQLGDIRGNPARLVRRQYLRKRTYFVSRFTDAAAPASKFDDDCGGDSLRTGSLYLAEAGTRSDAWRSQELPLSETLARLQASKAQFPDLIEPQEGPRRLIDAECSSGWRVIRADVADGGRGGPLRPWLSRRAYR